MRRMGRRRVGRCYARMSFVGRSRFARRNDTRRSDIRRRDTMSRDGLLRYRLLLLSDYDNRADLSLRLFVEQRLLRLIAVAQATKLRTKKRIAMSPKGAKK